MYHLSARSVVLSRCNVIIRAEKKLLNSTSYRLKSASSKSATHIPVMLKEVLNLWLPNDTQNGEDNRPIHLVDGTVGMGGHTIAALQSNNNVHVLGIDRDASMIYNAKKHIQSTNNDVSSRVKFHHGSFTDISQQLASLSKTADGILIDLGMNSIQISNPTRGFTFRNVDCPLDMRFDTSSTNNTSIKASNVVNEYTQSELSNIFTRYADEPYADEIAEDIVEWRTQVSQGRRAKQGIYSTLELRYIIEEAVDKCIFLNEDIDDEPEIDLTSNKRYHIIPTTTKPTKQVDKKKKKKFESYRAIWNSPSYLNPKKKKQLLSQYQQRKVRYANHVMRCFQAIRIEVNNELEHIKLFFQQFDTNTSSPILQVGGRIVIIVFHPGEDLIVRQGMVMLVDSGNYKLITPKDEGLRPNIEEVKLNSRSRTARLHAVERIR